MSPLRVAASKGSEWVKAHIKVVRSESYISTLHSKSVLQRETDVKWRQTVNGLCQFGPVTGNLSGSHSDASIHSLLHPIHFKYGSSCRKNYTWTSLTFVRVTLTHKILICSFKPYYSNSPSLIWNASKNCQELYQAVMGFLYFGLGMRKYSNG